MKTQPHTNHTVILARTFELYCRYSEQEDTNQPIDCRQNENFKQNQSWRTQTETHRGVWRHMPQNCGKNCRQRVRNSRVGRHSPGYLSEEETLWEKNGDVDLALGTWFAAVRNKKQTVKGPMLMEKSQQFAEWLGTDFTPSVRWLSRWKIRMGIKRPKEKRVQRTLEAEKWPKNPVSPTSRFRLQVGPDAWTNVRLISGFHCICRHA